MELSPREQAVLSCVVEHYIDYGNPAGSRTISRLSRLSLSPATIRNVMAGLKDKGLLEQPHTSAGAAPTETGLRYYLDTALDLKPLSSGEQRIISSTLGQSGYEVTDLMRRASGLLSAISRQTAVVVAPAPDNVRVKHIDFVPLTSTMVMALLVLQGGIVQRKVVTCREPMTSDQLTRYANYLNGLFENMTVLQAQAHILGELTRAGRGLSDLSRRALDLAKELLESEEERELFVEGAANLFEHPEFSDVKSMRDLIALLQERSRVLDLLARAMRETGVNIVLGGESGLSELRDVGLIATTYTMGDMPAGVLGIMGPARMDYAKVVPVVEYTANALSLLLSSRL